MSEYYFTREEMELYHHGIKGQKWGNRRWQNEDGSLTPAGREHYGYGARAQYKNRVGMAKAAYKAKDRAVQEKYFKKLESIEKGYKRGQQLSEKDQKRELDLDNKTQAAWKANKEAYKAERKAAKEEYKQSDEYKARQAKLKKAAKIGLAVAGTALAAYGGYKLHNFVKDKQYEKAMSLMKQAKFRDTLNGKYKDIASNYGTRYANKYDGINGIVKQKYIDGNTKLDYDRSKMDKYYWRGESMRKGADRLANKADRQYIKYLGGIATRKGRKLRSDLKKGNMQFSAYNALRNRNR